MMNFRSIRSLGLGKLPLVWLVACLAGAAWLVSMGASPKPEHTRKLHTKAIEDIKVGDYVVAKDPNEAGPPTPHRVTALPRNWTEHIVHVQVTGGMEIQATRHHPFWISNRGWTDAQDLLPGDKLSEDDDRRLTIDRIWIEDRTTGTYNLTVDGVHTYYVVTGSHSALVHNAPFGNVGGGGPINGGDALSLGSSYLGPGYSEISPGVYRSADNLRQFRMTSGDLTGAHGNIGPHVHFESIGPDGRSITENSHVQVCP